MGDSFREKNVRSLMDSLSNAMRILMAGNADTSLIQGIEDAISVVSGEVYFGIKSVSTMELLTEVYKAEKMNRGYLRDKYILWDKEVRSDLEELIKEKNVIDRNFVNLLLFSERCSEKDILEGLILRLEAIKSTNESYYNSLIKFYQKYTHFWGAINPDEGVYEHFTDRIQGVKDHVCDIRWLYDHLGDYRSKKVLYGIIRFWLLFDLNVLPTITESNFDDYFDMDLLNGKITEDEVFVDCGLYTGDTIESYLANFFVYKKMYLYDMVPKNIDHAAKKLQEYDNLVFRNFGVGNNEQSGQIIKVKNIESSAGAISTDGMSITPDADDSVESVDIPLLTLDDDIKEAVTFIKMDIEGAELDALKGSERHIKEERPKLAICTYHHYRDLWEIPRLIASYRDDYQFYMRYHGNNPMPMEFYLLAI